MTNKNMKQKSSHNNENLNKSAQEMPSPNQENPTPPSSLNFEDTGTSENESAVHQKEIDTLKDSLMRAIAETENIRKRSQKQIEDAAKYGVSNFARDMLNVCDNLNRALQSVTADDRKDTKIDSLFTGVEMTEKMLLQSFEKAGIKKLHPKGEKFDHNFHQAMVEIPDPNIESGLIIEVFQDGYVIHDRLLRPAMVSVAKNTENNGNDSSEESQKLDIKA